MVSFLTHTYAALTGAAALSPAEGRWKFIGLSVLCSTLPDADVVGFRLGIAYEDLLGHRGLSHSLAFAIVLALAVVSIAYRDRDRFSPSWWRLWAWFAFIGASHGVLDALTDGGLGIAFFSPFDPTRYFLPWRPILVSPIGIENLFSAYGVQVLSAEIKTVWLGWTAVVVALALWRRRQHRRGLVA